MSEQAATTTEKGTSLWKDAWHRLRRNRLAMAGLVLVDAIVRPAGPAGSGLAALLEGLAGPDGAAVRERLYRSFFTDPDADPGRAAVAAAMRPRASAPRPWPRRWTTPAGAGSRRWARSTWMTSCLPAALPG